MTFLNLASFITFANLGFSELWGLIMGSNTANNDTQKTNKSPRKLKFHLLNFKSLMVIKIAF